MRSALRDAVAKLAKTRTSWDKTPLTGVFRSFAEEGGLTPVRYLRFMNVFTGFLPYLRLPMSPSFGAFLDALIRPIPLSRFAFVNQLFVARNP